MVKLNLHVEENTTLKTVRTDVGNLNNDFVEVFLICFDHIKSS